MLSPIYIVFPACSWLLEGDDEVLPLDPKNTFFSTVSSFVSVRPEFVELCGSQ